MKGTAASRLRFLGLGPGTGWHADQLRSAADKLGHSFQFVDYESLKMHVSGCDKADWSNRRVRLECSSGSLLDYDAILTRTMPASSMERITFRLTGLHAIADGLLDTEIPIVNPPRSLEWSIDKAATLVRLAEAGFQTPATRFVQSRSEAMQAFDELGGDCVVKPIFGGEGRGVMRITDSQLAWYAFSTLDRLEAVLQIQEFISPGSRDTRLLVIGDEVIAVRRRNSDSFRSNVSAGAICEGTCVDESLRRSALRIARIMGLVFASVDTIDNDHGPNVFLEVNAIPGWKGAQSVVQECIATRVVEVLAERSRRNRS